MRAETFLQKVWIKILKKLGIIEELKIDTSDMCKSAIASDICSKSCENCAWSNEKSEGM